MLVKLQFTDEEKEFDFDDIEYLEHFKLMFQECEYNDESIPVDMTLKSFEQILSIKEYLNDEKDLRDHIIIYLYQIYENMSKVTFVSKYNIIFKANIKRLSYYEEETSDLSNIIYNGIPDCNEKYLNDLLEYSYTVDAYHYLSCFVGREQYITHFIILLLP